MNSFTSFFNRVIEYSFYSIFILVPLVFSASTSELFEFNKILVTYALAIVIAVAWISKMILLRKIQVQKTPLDIPITLFAASQIISTIVSWDQHISIWGYYSRFNGGLLSILTYIFLFYAFVSNLELKHVYRSLIVSIVTGVLVALWGLPSHFGYDPTCFLFKGTFDVSCWTEAFQPKVRIFSTLGQPNWLGAYLSILLPITIAFMLSLNKNTVETTYQKNKFISANYKTILVLLFITAELFFLDILYANSQSGFLGLLTGLLIFIFLFFIKELRKNNFKKEFLAAILILFLISGFFAGYPIQQLKIFTYSGLTNLFSHKNLPKLVAINPQPVTPSELGGGTDSGKIRKIVWRGALEAFKNYPLFGTGVETFAFAYYRFRPQEHNLTSEWDFLYNKAHNEYLNYLVTTGAFGLGSYLLMITMVLLLAASRSINTLAKLINQLFKKAQDYQPLSLRNFTLTLSLLGAYISILVSNFFGFSVVIINIYMFLIPGFILILLGYVKPRQEAIDKVNDNNVSVFQWINICILIIVGLFFIITLMKYWSADVSYAIGANLDRSGEYAQAYSKLAEAVTQRDEPVFKDELSINSAYLAAGFYSQKQASTASKLADSAKQISNELTTQYPYNMVFWKTRTRIFYILSQIDPSNLSISLEAIKKAHELAPTDAKIAYNLGIIYGQAGDLTKGIDILEKTIQLKQDYRDAYYALGLLYHQQSDKSSGSNKQILQKKATESMRFILDNLSSTDAQAKQSLITWGEKI